MIAEHDTLRDEGRAYADALRAAGVQVAVSEYHDQMHGFLSLVGDGGAARTRAVHEIAGALSALA